MTVLGIATSAEEALERCGDAPDLVFVDVDLGHGAEPTGVWLAARFVETCPEAKVVVLAAHGSARGIRDAIASGVHGYLTKDTSARLFLRSVMAILGGDVVIPQRLAASSLGARTAEEESARLLEDQLTPREREVLGLLVEGASSEQIAVRLTVSPNTVRTHIQNVLTKLQVRSRLEAAAFAVRWGLVSVGPEHQPVVHTP